MSTTHHISRLHYQVSCPDEEQAFALRHMLSAITTAELTDVMQAVSDRCVTGDQFVRIPRLEIRLEAASLNGLAGELAARFAATLEAELRRQASAPEPSAPQTGIPPQAAAFAHYLLHGYAPHWAIPLMSRMDELAREALRSTPGQLRQLLLANAADSAVWERLAGQFDTPTLEAVIALFPELQAARENLRAVWVAREQRHRPEPHSPEPPEPVAAIRQVILRNGGRILLGAQSADALAGRLELYLSATPPGTATPVEAPESVLTPAPGPSAGASAPHEAQGASDLALATTGAQPSAAAGDTPDEKLRTHTAGLVLLHPFLGRFFRTSGLLLPGGSWIDEPARQRAIHMLHYLATGRQQQGEWHLLLEKILCGLAPEMPIERDIRLTADEMAECDELLRAVIEHWTALKKTSVRGLQETFLGRAGLLLRTEQGWLLQVEQKTYDVLMEALPWGLSQIKLSWNDYTIEVIWN